jgi:HAMP domain-containing protein
MDRLPANSRISLRGSIAARLAVGYGLLVAAAMAALSGIVYFGTVGVFERSIDNKVMAVEDRLVDAWRDDGRQALVREIDAQLHDLIDTDTEMVGLLDTRGRIVSGNLGSWQGTWPAPGELTFAQMQRNNQPVSVRMMVTRLVIPLHLGELTFAQMQRNNQPVSVRMMVTRLGDGTELVVGRDLIELDAIRSVVERALLLSAAVSILLAFAGAQLFRTRLEARIGQIRRITARIAAGELSSRVVVHGNDEFARLGEDINRMLDRIEALMEGVRRSCATSPTPSRTTCARRCRACAAAWTARCRRRPTSTRTRWWATRAWPSKTSTA